MFGFFFRIMFMANMIEKYLPSLPSEIYKIPQQIASVIDYALDNYFKKAIELSADRGGRPEKPRTHIKELWLGCEIHNTTSINYLRPRFAKPQIAWAMSKLFESGMYKIVPFIDTYEWKDDVKDYFTTQQESIQTDIGSFTTLPIYGNFFVVDEVGNTMMVFMDLNYESLGCSVAVMTSNDKKPVAEKFMADLCRSMEKSDIYRGKCLAFVEGQLEFVDVHFTTWGDIILKDDVVQEIHDNSVGIIKNMESLSMVGMVPSRSMILISPPGMAKTTIFRAISHEVGSVTRIWCTGKSIDRPDDVTSLFEAARALAPCVIFIEDMDLFGRDRMDLSSKDGRILNEFLTCLDGMTSNSGVVIVASTNDMESMDEALINRPGRFDVKIEIPYPDSVDRNQMLRSFLSRVSVRPDETVTRDVVKNVVDLTDGLTGAYIKELVNATVIRAIGRGRISDGVVVFDASDLVAAAEQVIRNFKIGKRAKAPVLQITGT